LAARAAIGVRPYYYEILSGCIEVVGIADWASRSPKREPNFPGGRPERPIDTGAWRFFGLRLCFGRESRILGRGGEKGLEIDLGKQGVEVSGNFGETNQEWTAGLSN